LDKEKGLILVKETKELARILGALIRQKEAQIKELNADYSAE
jgi:hypothetical protein